MTVGLVKNITTAAHCRRCGDDAMIQVEADQVVGKITYEGAYAPCPDCEMGHRLDMSGRWGESGFWERHHGLRLALPPVPKDRPLTPEEYTQVAEMAKAFTLHLAGVEEKH
jgi:hypothetical protein